MSDFYSVLKQSIIDRGLSTPESRDEAYAQARRAMVNRLWAYDPPLAEDEIDHRIGQFDTAVARIEDDVVSVFATMAAEAAADRENRRYGDEDSCAPFGHAEDAHDRDPDDDDDRTLPELGPVPGALRAIEERSLAVQRALSEIDDRPVEPAPRETASYDADLAGWPGSGTETDDHDDIADDERMAPASAPRPAPQRARPAQKPAPKARPPAVAGPSRTAPRPAPARRPKPAGRRPGLYALIGGVAILALILVGGLIWLLLPRGTETGDGTVVLQTEVPGGVSDPDTAIRLPREAIAVTSSFSLFDGKDPTVFAGDPDNPVRFDGEYARIATSIASGGAKAIIGAGLSSRLAGKTIRVTIDARAARENGATSMRFAYQSGVAISHWQTANLSSEFTELGLVWRVPALRTNPIGDFIIIEPGIPGSGTGVEIRSLRIDLVDG